MGSKRAVVTGEEELKLRRQWDLEVLPKALENRRVFDRLRSVFQEMSAVGVLDAFAPPEMEPSTAYAPRTPKKRDLAELYRAQYEAWYRSLGFPITVPALRASNREIARRQRLGQTPVYRPASHEVSYEAFMTAVGQRNHWTVTDQAERAKIGWEPTATGDWFWAETQDTCPRLTTSRNDLMQTIHLLSLEEYVIVWHAVKHLQQRMLDRSTWCWLRTSFGPSGALNALEYGGAVGVFRYSADDLSIAYDDGGGRAADPVTNPA